MRSGAEGGSTIVEERRKGEKERVEGYGCDEAERGMADI